MTALLALQTGLQKYYKFKFKNIIASYTRQSVHRSFCNKVSHIHENLIKQQNRAY